MGKQQPSILNDVIGPVMRGPSSSHVAGAARIGQLIRQALEGQVEQVTCDFDVNGSLAESHDGQGTDMGFACGLLALPLTDSRVGNYEELLSEAGIQVEYRILDFGAEHPNHYRIHGSSGMGRSVEADAISTGGGMMELIRLDGFPVSVRGDYFETCCFVEGEGFEKAALERALRELLPAFESVSVSGISQESFASAFSVEPMACMDIRTSRALAAEEESALKDRWKIRKMYRFSPVLPTRSRAFCQVPFLSASELLAYNKDRGMELWELALEYESARGTDTGDRIFGRMADLAQIMKNAVKIGLAGTDYADRILQAQAKQIEERNARLFPCELMNRTIKNITALMEAKSAMEVIVAAPTAGSCGCLPGTLLAVQETLGLPEEAVVKGLLAAGLVGVFFTERATFAAEVGGCQMECGAAAGMAAAGAAQMMGASAEECLDAASMALQSLTGLVCDPVANRVEVPCLNKNITAGMSALASATMAMAGFDKVIPLDETIDAMHEIGMKLPQELCCSLGGLGKTPSSMEIRRRLEQGETAFCGSCSC